MKEYNVNSVYQTGHLIALEGTGEYANYPLLLLVLDLGTSSSSAGGIPNLAKCLVCGYETAEVMGFDAVLNATHMEQACIEESIVVYPETHMLVSLDKLRQLDYLPVDRLNKLGLDTLEAARSKWFDANLARSLVVLAEDLYEEGAIQEAGKDEMIATAFEAGLLSNLALSSEKSVASARARVQNALSSVLPLIAIDEQEDFLQMADVVGETTATTSQDEWLKFFSELADNGGFLGHRNIDGYEIPTTKELEEKCQIHLWSNGVNATVQSVVFAGADPNPDYPTFSLTDEATSFKFEISPDDEFNPPITRIVIDTGNTYQPDYWFEFYYLDDEGKEKLHSVDGARLGLDDISIPGLRQVVRVHICKKSDKR